MRRAMVPVIAAHLALVTAFVTDGTTDRTTVVTTFAAYLAAKMAVAVHVGMMAVTDDDGCGCGRGGRNSGGKTAETDCKGERDGCKLGCHYDVLNCYGRPVAFKTISLPDRFHRKLERRAIALRSLRA